MRKVGQREKWGDKSGATKVRHEKSGAKRKVGKREK